jgi:uncharacterized protein
VKMTDVRPLQGYTLNFEGSGGSAGFARGSSVVTLAAVDGATLLSYTAQASVAGKLGQIGGRLMDASAGQLAAKFFNSFKAHLSEDEVSTSAAAPAAPVAGSFADGAPTAPSQPALSATARAGQMVGAAFGTSAPSAPPAGSWTDRELPRLLWFAAGVAATSLGVWMGAHWLH